MSSAPTPPREAPRRVSDADDLALREIAASWITHSERDSMLARDGNRIIAVLDEIADSRAREADLTRRLAEAKRREHKAWCAGRDAAAEAVKAFKLNNRQRRVLDHEYGTIMPGTHIFEQVAQPILVGAIRVLNPPKPEGDRG